jgi:L-alanine-DL-glutamate epimerase-like enolase superfamily enzyme
VAEGRQAVKVKVDKPDLREDAERIAAVREVIGPDRALRIDANQRWDLPTTLRALDRLAEYGLH